MLTQSLRSRVYLLVHPGTEGDAVARTIRAALRAQVGLVCFDPGDRCRRDALDTLVPLLRISRSARLPVLVAGAVDLALAAGAEGVHVDASDLPVACVRRLLGPAAIIGVTARSSQDAKVAEADGATFVMVDGVYGNGLHASGALVGAEGLARVRAVCSLPICACGGVTPERVREVVGCGAELIGVRTDPAAVSPEDMVSQIRALAAAFPMPPHVAP